LAAFRNRRNHPIAFASAPIARRSSHAPHQPCVAFAYVQLSLVDSDLPPRLNSKAANWSTQSPQLDQVGGILR
jgi:hypothetical protein